MKDAIGYISRGDTLIIVVGDSDNAKQAVDDAAASLKLEGASGSVDMPAGPFKRAAVYEVSNRSKPLVDKASPDEDGEFPGASVTKARTGMLSKFRREAPPTPSAPKDSEAAATPAPPDYGNLLK